MAALGNPENLESEDPNQIPRRKRLHRRGKWGRGSRTSYCKCSHALSYSLGIEIRSVVVESFGSTIHLSSLKCETCIFHNSGRTSISNACVNSRRASVDQSVSSGSNVACATSATGNAGNKEVVFQSPFLGLKDVMCKQVKEAIDLKFNRYFTELDTKAEEYFNKMEAIAEDHHKGILDSVYKAISDSFWNQTVLKNQIE